MVLNSLRTVSRAGQHAPGLSDLAHAFREGERHFHRLSHSSTSMIAKRAWEGSIALKERSEIGCPASSTSAPSAHERIEFDRIRRGWRSGTNGKRGKVSAHKNRKMVRCSALTCEQHLHEGCWVASPQVLAHLIRALLDDLEGHAMLALARTVLALPELTRSGLRAAIVPLHTHARIARIVLMCARTHATNRGQSAP